MMETETELMGERRKSGKDVLPFPSVESWTGFSREEFFTILLAVWPVSRLTESVGKWAKKD
jgi:hypothetical protein